MKVNRIKSCISLIAIFAFGLFTDYSEAIPENLHARQEVFSAGTADLSAALVNNYSAEEGDSKVTTPYTLDFLVVLNRIYTTHVQTCLDQTRSLKTVRYKIPVYLHLLKIVV